MRSAAERIKGLTDEVHGIVNSAGIMAPQNFTLSRDGVESQFASNHLGHFLLTNLLLPEIAAARGVIVNMTGRATEIAAVQFEHINITVSDV